MKVLIIEDEKPAVQRLQQLLLTYQTSIEVMQVLDSVEDSILWLQQHSQPKLIFLDIYLADGISFDIFKAIEVQTPIIFTTAYNQFMLKAFEVNSIDYLLKPINEKQLHKAIQKFEKLYEQKTQWNFSILQELKASLTQKNYRKRFLIKSGQQYLPVQLTNIAYIYAESGIIFAVTQTNRRYIIDHSLDKLDTELDPNQFFRINRQMMVHIDAVKKIATYFNHRLKLELHPKIAQDVIVSRTRTKAFKQWIDN